MQTDYAKPLGLAKTSLQPGLLIHIQLYLSELVDSGAFSGKLTPKDCGLVRITLEASGVVQWCGFWCGAAAAVRGHGCLLCLGAGALLLARLCCMAW